MPNKKLTHHLPKNNTLLNMVSISLRESAFLHIYISIAFIINPISICSMDSESITDVYNTISIIVDHSSIPLSIIVHSFLF